MITEYHINNNPINIPAPVDNIPAPVDNIPAPVDNNYSFTIQGYKNNPRFNFDLQTLYQTVLNTHDNYPELINTINTHIHNGIGVQITRIHMEHVPGQNKRNIYLTLHENDTNEDATIKLVVFNENANYCCELGRKDTLRTSGKLENFNFVEHTPRTLPISLANQHENISTIEIFANAGNISRARLSLNIPAIFEMNGAVNINDNNIVTGLPANLNTIRVLETQIPNVKIVNIEMDNQHIKLIIKKVGDNFEYELGDLTELLNSSKTNNIHVTIDGRNLITPSGGIKTRIITAQFNTNPTANLILRKAKLINTMLDSKPDPNDPDKTIKTQMKLPPMGDINRDEVLNAVNKEYNGNEVIKVLDHFAKENPAIWHDIKNNLIIDKGLRNWKGENVLKDKDIVSFQSKAGLATGDFTKLPQPNNLTFESYCAVINTLAVLNYNGIYHYDIKPGNMFSVTIQNENDPTQIKYIIAFGDFGEAVPGNNQHDAAGATLNYLSPMWYEYFVYCNLENNDPQWDDYVKKIFNLDPNLINKEAITQAIMTKLSRPNIAVQRDIFALSLTLLQIILGKNNYPLYIKLQQKGNKKLMTEIDFNRLLDKFDSDDNNDFKRKPSFQQLPDELKKLCRKLDKIIRNCYENPFNHGSGLNNKASAKNLLRILQYIYTPEIQEKLREGHLLE